MTDAQLAGHRRFELFLERNGHVLTVALRGEIDMAAVLHLDPRLEEATSDPTDYVVLDLASVTFLDSTGLRMLIRLQERLKGKGSLLLSRLSQPVQRLLDLTKLTNMFAYLNGAPPNESVCPWCGAALKLDANRCSDCGGVF